MIRMKELFSFGGVSIIQSIPDMNLNHYSPAASHIKCLIDGKEVGNKCLQLFHSDECCWEFSILLEVNLRAF